MLHKPCRTCQPAGLILYRRHWQHIKMDAGKETSASTRSTTPADTSSSTDSRQHQSARPRQSKDRQTASNAGQIPDARHTRHTSNNITEHNVPPRLRDGRVTRHRAGHPLDRLTLAGIPAGKAAAGAAQPPARRLPWPCRPADRPAIPPAGGVLRAPPRAKRGEGGACRRQCARRYRLPPAAAARAEQAAQPRSELAARRGASARGAARRGASDERQREPRGAATPGGECVGRAERHALRRRRWACWRGWPERRRPGRRRGRPQSPHIVGAGPRRSTYAAPSAGCSRGKAARSAHRRCLALRRLRVACATAGGWQAPQARRPEPRPTLRSSCRR